MRAHDPRAWIPLVLGFAVTVSPAVLASSPGPAAPAPAAPGSGAAPGWSARIREDIASREYEVTWQVEARVDGMPPAWQAPNRAHGFRTYFMDEGIRVVPRTEAGPSWLWGLTFAGYGRGSTAWPVSQAIPRPAASRVEYRRGDVDEWYVNAPRGLEQGFTLQAAPEEAARRGKVGASRGRSDLPGRGRGSPREGLLHLDLSLSGSLMPLVAADGQSIDFALPGGDRVVRYAELLVTDATGRTLPAWMEGVADETVRGIRIVVDDQGAVYPIIVDPLATSPVWAVDGGQASALLGYLVATAGDVNGDGFSDVMVGAPYFDGGQTDEGRAFVFLGSAGGPAGTPAWTAESDQAGAVFGAALATAGDVNGDGYSDVIVGAEGFTNGEKIEGSAYIYLGSANGLAVNAAWMKEGNQADHQFGTAVATAEDVNGDGYSDVIVGAASFDNNVPDLGTAFVYLGSAGGLAVDPAWTVAGDQLGCQFGLSVATAGDVNGDGYSDVIVGAPSYSNGQSYEGKAFAYLGSAGGLATTPAWTAEVDQASGAFADTVATAGDVNGDGYSDVIVGAPNYDSGQTDEGKAFAYLGSAGGLAATPAWTAEIDQANAYFGWGMSSAGDVNGDGYSDVIIGAVVFDTTVQNDVGGAFVYPGSAGGLAGTPAWTATGPEPFDYFGQSVATAGDVNGDGYSDVLVGAPYLDSPTEFNAGGAFVYLGSAGGLAVDPAWTVAGDQLGCQFGLSVATAGDVNGDGYSDVIVGAPSYSNGQIDEGKAFAYLGSTGGLATTPAWTAEGDQNFASFAVSVATAGDVNGDGFSEVIVGTLEGLAFAYLGSTGGLATTPAWTAVGIQIFSFLGLSVSSAGDVNGDGYSDVIVGATLFDTTAQNDVGGAFVYLGSAGGLASTPAWTATGPEPLNYFGQSVATAGDVNGDGYSDVLVGAPYLDSPTEIDAGGAFIYLGSVDGPAAAPSWTVESDQPSAGLGWSVAPAGDVNGDGYSDVLVGAPAYDSGQADEGRAFMYLGSAGGLGTAPAWSAESNQPGAVFGFSVSSAGDVNGDGYADVAVGAYAFDAGQSDEGRAFAYLGSAGGLGLTPAWTAEGNQVSAWFGNSVGAAGDVNGDGYSDVIVGAENYDNGESEEGRAFVYLGSAGGLGLTPAWTAENNRGGSRFGYSVATAGDVDGDGYSDVIVGAPFLDTFIETSVGEASVYLGSAGGLANLPAWSVQGSLSYFNLGFSVATAGDVNGDGYSDVIVGEPGLENGQFQINEGGALVYLGSAGGLASTAAWTVESDQGYAYLGWSVSPAGDVNGDGFSDVMVGAPYFDGGQTDEGMARVFLGSASGLGLAPAWTAESDQAFANLGYSAAAAGDVNGDGYSDLLVGAPNFTNGQASEGRAFMSYGNGGRGLAVRPQQRRADNAAPIAPGLHARTPGSFRLAALGHGPGGRSPVRLEWEVKARGLFFDGSGTERGTSWTDSGVAGASLNEMMSGLEPAAYHWRVRLIYRPTASPFLPASRWFSVPVNGALETDVTVSAFIGGVVWEDVDGDGTRDAGEPGLARLQVYLQNSGGVNIGAAFTDTQGSYRFEILDAAAHRVLFTLPSGYQYALPDQGADDTLDSDADPLTGQTSILGPPFQAVDGISWSAGMLRIGPCVPPDEPIFIYNVRLSTNGTNFPILDFQDPNQTFQRTGYNVRRSSNPALPTATWPILSTNVVDMDAATANLQWVDTSGAVSPSGAWYYQVTAFNAACGAEGPF